MHILKQSELDGMPCPDTLIHGECIASMKHIADGSVDAIIADLPYQTTKLKWDTLIPFEPLWEAYKRVIKPNGAIVLFGSQPFTTTLISSNLDDFRHGWCWDKTRSGCFTQAKVMPMKTHEDICVFCKSKGNPKYYPQMVEREKVRYFGSAKNSQVAGVRINQNTEKLPVGKPYTHSYPTTILRFSLSSDLSRGLHPTQKPTALLEYLVRTYTNPGDLVLDNCMGSATLPVACIRTGRYYIGIEKDDAYFAASVERVRAALAQQAFAFDAPPSA